MDSDTYREALGKYAAGVTVVTTRGLDDAPAGFTATSFCSLSLHPPLVLFCYERNAASYDLFANASGFAVNLLTARQRHLSVGFARKGEDKFAGVAYRLGEWGQPILEGCLAVLECELWAKLPGGDHTIFVGEVKAVYPGSGEPLLYCQGDYRIPAPLPPSDG